MIQSPFWKMSAFRFSGLTKCDLLAPLRFLRGGSVGGGDGREAGPGGETESLIADIILFQNDGRG
jgi:hypothetical protein